MESHPGYFSAVGVNFIGQFQKNYPLMRSFNELLATFFCMIRFVVAACALNGIFVIVIIKLLLDLSFGAVLIMRASRTDINVGQFHSPDLMRSFTEVFATLVSLVDFFGKAFLMDVSFVLAIFKINSGLDHGNGIDHNQIYGVTSSGTLFSSTSMLVV